ncbi:MAG: metal ABC transporter ATP-binding protein [Deltaproteobacteria bacterium]|nr:metal ABC transporter ATP-binding protein [Deltaproteobacteria bacterium]MBZ0219892.1 metal ABC transporter ATP-binding protein [Deltaproteobacteria bacterium]
MEDNLILNVEDLKVALDHRVIIDHLSFSVKKGDIVTILGPNGAGKTVLLRCLLGLLPYTGKIQWEEGIKIGYVPQRLPFIKDIPMSVMDFFGLKRGSEQEVRDIVHAVGFGDEIFERRIGDLSSGQFQRILIAWGLIGGPHVLLFDEPTTGIDIGGEETIYNLLAKLRKERQLSILLVTHDLNVVYEFSTYVICLSRPVVCCGPPQEVLTTESLQSLYGGKVKYYKHKPL